MTKIRPGFWRQIRIILTDNRLKTVIEAVMLITEWVTALRKTTQVDRQI